MKRRQTWIALLTLLGSLVASAVQAQAPADRWTFTLTPYLWLPSVDGSLRYGPPATGGAPNVGIDGDSLLEALDFAFMLAGEARKGRWSITTDYIYLDLSSDSSSIKSIDFNPGSGPVNVRNTSLNVNADTELKGSLWTLIGGYSVIYQPRHTMDIIGGVRYLHLKASTSWLLSAAVAGPIGSRSFDAAGRVEKSDDLWDVIIGVRGRVKIGDGNWFVPYHLDAGGGSSRLTWQGLLGVGYSFKWGDLLFNYRYLSYEQGGNKLIDELTFGGFSAGVAFRF